MPTQVQTRTRFRSYLIEKPNVDAPDTDSIQIISNRIPALVAGTYSAKFTQAITAPDGKSDTLSSEQRFAVRVPQLRLDPNVDVHSVFPAPGHSECANTLPHIVFNDAALPWERSVSTTSPDSFNTIPWIALLTFTEDELNVPAEDLTRYQMQPQQGSTYTASVKAGDLREPTDAGLISPVQKIEKNFKDNESVDCLMLKPDFFKRLFGSYVSGAAASTFSGKPDFSPFSYLAHIRSVNPQAMASTSPGDTELKVSLLLGHRVAPIGLPHPTNMISHLVSLEGLDRLDFSNNQTEYIGLVSLHSWTWMALPPEHVDFISVMDNLGKSIQPLRMKNDFLASLTKAAPSDDNAAWLRMRLQDSYILKPSTSMYGDTSTTMFRGPFTATMPTRIDESVKPWSTSGTDLQVVDTRTGIVDVSYQAAWQLGRLLAVGDTAFTTSLLRLRGKIHETASKLVREAANPDFVKMSQFTSQLTSAVDYVVKADKTENIQVGKMNTTLRWCNGWPHSATISQNPATKIGDVMDTPQYYKQIENAALDLTRARGKTKTPQNIYNEENDPKSYDWANILAWIMDVLFSDKIPLHYLIPDPESLPRESIRTFFVDPLWLECVVDGALSLASHFQHADLTITRELKDHINEFLRTPQDALLGQKPRLPKWGFVMRSIAISSFPDLRIEAPLKAGDKSGQSEILYLQRISEDVILCLTDRIPGETTFTELLISQPGHQQGFCFGNKIDDKLVSFTFKRLSTKPGATLPTGESRFVDRTWNRDRKNDEPLPVFDWTNRIIIMSEFAKQCMATLQKTGYFDWKTGSPSSILSSQLTRAAFFLGVISKSDSTLQQYLVSPAKSPWLVKDGCRQIYVPDASQLYRPAPATQPQEPPTPTPLPHVDLPVNHRPQAKLVRGVSASAFASRPATDISYWNYWGYYWGNRQNLFMAGAKVRGAGYFSPSIDCFPLHLGKSPQIRLDPYVAAPMDIVFKTKGHTNSNFFPLNVDLIEWMIPVKLPSVTLTGDFDIEPVMFRVGGTVDHPELPTAEPIETGCKWIYDTRLIRGTFLDYMNQGGEYIAVPKPEKQNLKVLLAVRARSRDNPWAEPTHPNKPIDASFLLKGVRWELNASAPLAEGDTVAYKTRFMVLWRNIHRSPVTNSFAKDCPVEIVAKIGKQT